MGRGPWSNAPSSHTMFQSLEGVLASQLFRETPAKYFTLNIKQFAH